MMKTIKIFLVISIMLSFYACSNNKTAKDAKAGADSLKKPEDYKSIEQREWEEHRKDTLRNNKDSDTTIIKYHRPSDK